MGVIGMGGVPNARDDRHGPPALFRVHSGAGFPGKKLSQDDPIAGNGALRDLGSDRLGVPLGDLAPVLLALVNVSGGEKGSAQALLDLHPILTEERPEFA